MEKQKWFRIRGAVKITPESKPWLNERFRELIFLLKTFLVEVERKCIEFDKSAKPDYSSQVCFIEENHEWFNQLDYFFMEMWKAISNEPKEVYLKHMAFFQSKLLRFFNRPGMTLLKHIYDKPYGYAGDFWCAKVFYDFGYTGESTYDKLMDRYTLWTPLVRSHTYRRTFFRNILKERMSSGKVKKAATFACGPAVEILDLLAEKIPQDVKFCCIDGERDAVKQIQKKITEIKKKQQIPEVLLFQDNILNIVRRKYTRPEWKNQDYVFSAGFFDYVKQRTATRIVRYLYDLLKPGGELVLVNVHNIHPCRVYLEMVGEWFLNYRDEEKMLDLAKELPGTSSVSVDFDPTRTNIYLHIKNRE